MPKYDPREIKLDNCLCAGITRGGFRAENIGSGIEILNAAVLYPIINIQDTEICTLSAFKIRPTALPPAAG